MKVEDVMNLHIDRIDIGLLMSNFHKYIEYSELNHDWQRRLKIQGLAKEIQIEDESTAQYYNQKEDSINEDYFINIPNVIRYSGLIMLFIYIEWFVRFCEQYSEEKGWGKPPNPKRKKIEKKIDWLRKRNKEAFYHPFDQKILDIIEIRNCVVHDAGEINTKNQAEAIKRLDGFSVGRFLYMENYILIHEGVIQKLATDAEVWMNSLLDYLGIGDKIPKSYVVD